MNTDKHRWKKVQNLKSENRIYRRGAEGAEKRLNAENN
jgi:hypothetical protein